MSNVCGEIVATLPLGLCGFDQFVWSGKAGAVWEIWKLAPCCGGPDFIGVALFFLHCLFCSPCSMCKLYSSSLNDNCSVWPHCFCFLCCPCMRWFTRYNLRKKSGTRGNIIGDFMCVFCCLSLCAWCQECRSVDPGNWRIVPEFSMVGFFVPGCRFLR